MSENIIPVIFFFFISALSGCAETVSDTVATGNARTLATVVMGDVVLCTTTDKTNLVITIEQPFESEVDITLNAYVVQRHSAEFNGRLPVNALLKQCKIIEILSGDSEQAAMAVGRTFLGLPMPAQRS